jgi:hypothetical protein
VSRAQHPPRGPGDRQANQDPKPVTPFHRESPT